MATPSFSHVQWWHLVWLYGQLFCGDRNKYPYIIMLFILFCYLYRRFITCIHTVLNRRTILHGCIGLLECVIWNAASTLTSHICNYSKMWDYDDDKSGQRRRPHYIRIGFSYYFLFLLCYSNWFFSCLLLLQVSYILMPYSPIYICNRRPKKRRKTETKRNCFHPGILFFLFCVVSGRFIYRKNSNETMVFNPWENQMKIARALCCILFSLFFLFFLLSRHIIYKQK